MDGSGSMFEEAESDKSEGRTGQTGVSNECKSAASSRAV